MHADLSAFPHALARLCIFAQFVGGYGEVRCRVRVVSAHSRDVVYQSPVQIVRFDERRQTRYFALRLTQITIHAAGEYWVEFYCNDQFVDDATLRFFA